MENTGLLHGESRDLDSSPASGNNLPCDFGEAEPQHLHLELTGLAHVVSKDPSCSNVLVFEAHDEDVFYLWLRINCSYIHN